MAAIPDKNTLDGTNNPTTSTFKAAMGALHDYLSGLLGAAGTPAAARTALGAAKSGANADITTLTGVNVPQIWPNVQNLEVGSNVATGGGSNYIISYNASASANSTARMWTRARNLTNTGWLDGIFEADNGTTPTNSRVLVQTNTPYFQIYTQGGKLNFDAFSGGETGINGVALANNTVSIHSPNFAGRIGLNLRSESTGSPNQHFILANQTGGDVKWRVDTNGDVRADGTFAGGGADFGEYIDWADGNPNKEDRRGCSVSLVGDKVKIAEEGEKIIGAVSVRATIVGGSHEFYWHGKYLKDDYGEDILEQATQVSWTEYEEYQESQPTDQLDENGQTVYEQVTKKREKERHSYFLDRVPDDIAAPQDAERQTVQRPKLNPDFDPTLEYIPTSKRKPCIGLIGIVPVRKTAIKPPHWIKLKDISVNTELYLIFPAP